MGSRTIIVRGTTDVNEIDLRWEAWALAFDQRYFGARKLLVAFADGGGRMLSFAVTDRPDPPEAALAPCIRQFGLGARAAVAFCDEMIDSDSPDLAARFAVARSTCAEWSVHLVDWFACDDLTMRSTRLALDASCDILTEWWDVS